MRLYSFGEEEGEWMGLFHKKKHPPSFDLPKLPTLLPCLSG